MRLRLKFYKITLEQGEDLLVDYSKPEEKLPISEFYKVVDYLTIFKSEDWWEAVVVFEAYGKRQIGFYLWQKRNGQWKRKNKFSVRTVNEWERLKGAVDLLSPELAEK